MDGNRRWARQRDLPELEGHAAGVEAIREILRHAVRRGVRGPDPVRLQPRELGPLGRRGHRPVRAARRRRPQRDRRAPPAGRPGPAARSPRRAPRRDPPVDRRGPRRDRGRRPAAAQHRLQLRRPHGARRRRPAADRRRASRPRPSTRRPSTRALYTAGLPDPDLLIRTGGEQRLSQLPDLAVGLRGVLLLRGRSGPTSGRTPSTRPCSSSPAASAASGADGRAGVRARALSCGRPRPGPARRPRPRRHRRWPSRSPSSTVLAAREVFAPAAGRRPSDAAAARHGARPDRRPRCGVPASPGGQRPAAAWPSGSSSSSVASFTRPDPHDGLATWMATVFGALYVAPAGVRRPARARRARSIPADAPLAGSRRGTRLDPAPAARRLVVRHRRVTSSAGSSARNAS